MSSVFSFPSIYIHQHYELIGLKCNKETCLCLQPLKQLKSPINQLLEWTWEIVWFPPMWGGTLISIYDSCTFFLSWPPFSSETVSLIFLHWIALTTLCTQQRRQTKGCKAIFTDQRSVYPEREFLHGSPCGLCEKRGGKVSLLWSACINYIVLLTMKYMINVT